MCSFKNRLVFELDTESPYLHTRISMNTDCCHLVAHKNISNISTAARLHKILLVKAMSIQKKKNNQGTNTHMHLHMCMYVHK